VKNGLIYHGGIQICGVGRRTIMCMMIAALALIWLA
jgi:hypothetical protein